MAYLKVHVTDDTYQKLMLEACLYGKTLEGTAEGIIVEAMWGKSKDYEKALKNLRDDLYIYLDHEGGEF